MQEITFKEKIFASLGLLILLISLPVALMVVKQRVTYRGRATGQAAVPINVRATNVHSVGFTVSWITNSPTNGSVLVDDVQNVSSPVELSDVRGTGDIYITHYVDVVKQNLDPEHDYYFKIKSGPDTYAFTEANGWYKSSDANAYGKKVRTAKQIGDESQPPSPSNPFGAYSTETGAFGPCPDGTLNSDGTPHMNSACFRPYPVWGEVKKTSGESIPGAIVFAAIKEISPDSPYTLSTIADTNGRWSLDLANQYTSNFTSYMSYNPAVDKINLYAESGTEGVSQGFQGLEMVSVLSTNCVNPPTGCVMNKPSPVILTLAGNGPTTPPTTPPSPGSGISFQINKVQLQGRTDQTKSFVLRFRQGNTIASNPVLATVSVTTNSSGMSQVINVPSLSSGSYDVYIVPSEGYLSAKLNAFNFGASQTTVLDFTNGAMIYDLGARNNNGRICSNTNGEVGKALCAGDIKNLLGGIVDEVDMYDFGKMLVKYGQSYPEGDFNKSGDIDMQDYGWVLTNFGKKGADKL